MTDILERIEDYLVVGGLFNPELMDHNKVRDIIIDARLEILSLKEDNKKLKYRLSMMKKIRNEKLFEKLIDCMAENQKLKENK